MTSFERYKADIEKLVASGQLLIVAMQLDLYAEQRKKLSEGVLAKLPDFHKQYQPWYSEALSCISQLLPARVDDFVSYYRPAANRKTLDAANYTVSDYLRHLASSMGQNLLVDQKAALAPPAAGQNCRSPQEAFRKHTLRYPRIGSGRSFR